MATRRHTNNFSTTLAADISNVATTAQLTSVTGLPTLSGSDEYRLTVKQGVNIEIWKVTANPSGTTLPTIVRAQEGTSGVAFTIGATVKLTATADSIDRKADTTYVDSSIPNTFTTVAVSGQSNVVADSTSDTLTFVAGTGITLTTNATTDTITITYSGGGGVADGDKGDITVSSSGATWTIDTPASATLASNDKILFKDTSASDALKYATFSAFQTPWNQNIDVNGFVLTNTSTADGVQITNSGSAGLIVTGPKVDIKPAGSTANTGATINLYEGQAGGTNKIALKAPDTLGGDYTFQLPNSNGTSGYFLQTDGSGNTSWVSVSTLSDGDKGDITVSSSGTAWSIDNDVVTYAKMQNVSATARIMGRNTAGAGDMEELTAATVKTMLSLNSVENTALSTWAGTSNITTLGTITTGTWSGTTIATSKGGTGVTSVTTTPTASSFAGWDVNSNLSANNFLAGYATITSAAGTTTLTVASARRQIVTGTTTQTIVLPVVSTLALGHPFIITNLSTGVVTVQSSGTNTVQAMQANSTLIVISNATTGTAASVWYVIDYTAAASGQTGSGPLVRQTSPTFVSPVLGTPASGVGTNLTGIPPSAVTGMKPWIQRVYTQTGAVATGTTIIPADDTIPQITEGFEIMTLSITPTNASNLLIITAQVMSSPSALSSGIVALFQDATANALTMNATSEPNSGTLLLLPIDYTMVAGTTSATTFRIRLGHNVAGTNTFNGASGGRLWGGVINSSLTITEYLV